MARPRLAAPHNYQVRALQRGLAILRTFNEVEPALTMAEISRRVGIPKATALRLLECLRQESFVTYDEERGRYALGTASLEVGGMYQATSPLAKRATPFLRRLAEHTAQTANLGVLDGHEVLHLAVVEPDRALRYHGRVGARDLAHCTGLGKVLAAGLDERRLRALIAAGLPRRTPATITEPGVFRQELEHVKQAGYAEDREEGAPGLRCLAAPVRDASGAVVAAVSISGAAAEFEDHRATYLAAVLDAASDLSTSLGWVRPAISVA